LVAKAMANAAAMRWAHIDATTTTAGRTIGFSDDVGPDSGHQIITGTGAHAEALLVGGVAYAKGDATTVTSYYGVPASDTGSIAGRWVSFTPRDGGYSNLYAHVALQSALSLDALIAPYRIGAPTVVDGQRVVPISGIVSEVGKGPSGLGTLYITPGSATLPVELVIAGSDGSRSDVKYSRWGVTVVLSAPPGAIPAAFLAARASE
jgi:hypothetical protein